MDEKRNNATVEAFVRCACAQAGYLMNDDFCFIIMICITIIMIISSIITCRLAEMGKIKRSTRMVNWCPTLCMPGSLIITTTITIVIIIIIIIISVLSTVLYD